VRAWRATAVAWRSGWGKREKREPRWPAERPQPASLVPKGAPPEGSGAGHTRTARSRANAKAPPEGMGPVLDEIPGGRRGKRADAWPGGLPAGKSSDDQMSGPKCEVMHPR